MKFKNPVSVVSPKKGEHATNKDYVDGKMVTKTWTEYQALSEEEKNNGTLYDIPDMPTAGRGGVITTYTALEQLGLNAGASVADIVNAMPNCSYAEIGCYSAEDYGLQHVTGLPNNEYNFLLTVRKYNVHRVDIIAKTSASGAVLNNMYIGGMIAGGTEVSWKEVCTTSVKDVDKTPFTVNSDTTNYEIQVNSNSNYLVRNGVCYVSLCVSCNSPSSGWVELCTIPKCASGNWHNSIPNLYNNDLTDLFVKAYNGFLHARNGSVVTSSQPYYINFSYPVAE